MNKIAIMQPYFMPYIGYFSLIKHTDSFILFDTAQFIRHGWIERNRILKQGGGWLYIKVPIIRESRDTIIKNVLINNDQAWKDKILAQLQPYKKIAPYYNEVVGIMERIFSNYYKSITDLNKAALESICDYLKIDNNITIFSEMNLDIEPANAPDEWALNICRALGNIDEYWNPPGGLDFFDKSKYSDAGIELKFQKPILDAYNQGSEEQILGLSIIDVLMFNSPLVINEMLDHYEFA